MNSNASPNNLVVELGMLLIFSPVYIDKNKLKKTSYISISVLSSLNIPFTLYCFACYECTWWTVAVFPNVHYDLFFHLYSIIILVSLNLCLGLFWFAFPRFYLSSNKKFWTTYNLNSHFNHLYLDSDSDIN